MRHLRSSFVTPVQFRFSCRSTAGRSVLQRRLRYAHFLIVDLPRRQSTASRVSPSLCVQQPSRTSRDQECINAFLKQLRQTHSALQSRRPPNFASVEVVLSSFKDVCLEIQTTLNRSLPGMSHLDRAISLARDATTSPRELARLLKPNGPLRMLCGAATTALSQIRVSAEYSSTDSKSPGPLQAARAAVMRHSSLRLRGSAQQRNADWRALPWEAMRAHPAVMELPETASLHITSPVQLRLLSQDGQAFARSRELFPLRADNVWRVLGLGEDEAVMRLGDALPVYCRGHMHALEGWQALFGEGNGRRNSFVQRYHVSHVPNAVLSYLAAAKAAFDGEFNERARWASPVQVRETGLVVASLSSGGALVASPVGQMLRRRREDFWAWAEREDALLLANTEMVFSSDGSGSEFGTVRPRKQLDALSFVEAQVSMLVCGEAFARADVVWHGVLGGMKTFRVERDDRLLELVKHGVHSFCERFVEERARPPARGFQVGDEFDELLERVGEGCERAKCVYDVRAEVDEMRMEAWRGGIGDWERQKSEMPFLQSKREKN